MCLCDPPLGVIEEMIKENERSKKCWRKTKCSSSKCLNRRCKHSNQCGKGGKCVYTTNQPPRYCKKPSRYDAFVDIIEETGPNMEMGIEEYDTDLDYGSTSYGVSSSGT